LIVRFPHYHRLLVHLSSRCRFFHYTRLPYRFASQRGNLYAALYLGRIS
jgi:hypothetical protein